MFLGGVLLLLGLSYLLFASGHNVVTADNNEIVLNVGKGNGPQMYGYNGVQFFDVNQEVVLKVDGYFKNSSKSIPLPENVQIDIYKAGIQNVLHFLEYEGKGVQKNKEINVGEFEHQASLEARFKEDFSLPVEGSGVWLVRVRAGGREVFVYVVRSSQGAVVKEEQKGLLFWTQDLNTKRSRAGVPIVIYSLRDKLKEKESVVTGEDGIAHTKTAADYDVAVVGRDNDLAIVPINLASLNVGYKSDENNYAGQESHPRSFLFTDRPLYKPGDKVYFKFIARLDDDFTYSVSEGKRTVEISSGWGDSKKVIATGEYDLDSFGSISGELLLPEDIKTGEYYHLEVIDKNQKAEDMFSWYNPGESIDIRVENYRKPEQKIEVSVEKREYISKDQVHFEIKGDYFSGEALANAQIEYVVRATRLSSWQQDNITDLDNLLRGYGYGEDVSKGTVTLNNDGQAEVNIEAIIEDGYSKVYSIMATYKPQSGEPVLSQQNILVYSGQYGIVQDVNRYSFTAGQDVNIAFKLKKHTAEATVANRNFKITGKRIWWEVENRDSRYRKYKRQEETVEVVPMTSDENGRVFMHFVPQKAGSYKFNITGTDDRGNQIKRDFNIWVNADSGDEFVSFDNSGLVIKVDKEKYQPDDKIEATISSQVPNRDILLSIERDFVHSFRVIHLEGTGKKIKFDIKKEYIPNINISVSSFDVGRLDHSVADVKISAESQKLNIKIETDKKSYSPGEEVKVKVLVRDKEDNPQEADITLWAIDKAIFELTAPGEQDIHKAFWDWRSGWTSSAHSLMGISIGFADGRGGCFLAGTKILMGNGQEKNIEIVKKGDSLTTFNEQGEKVIAKVIETHQAVKGGYLVINNSLRVTADHILWINDGWQKAETVRPGDWMKGADGRKVIINSVVWHRGRREVYNLIVEKEHSYIADGYFVHNGKDGGERSIFKDTAYWNPRVRTDKNGLAEVSFKLPDDLTTWVITAIGDTKETLVGTETKEIKTAKPISIRPQLPNILQQGDNIILTAVAQNNTGKKQLFTASLQVDVGQVKTSEQKISIPAGQSKIVSWEVKPEIGGKKEVEFVFSLSMDGRENLRDAVRKNIPVERFGFWESDSFVGGRDNPYFIKIDSDVDREESLLKLTLASNKLGALSGAMKYLIHYPYGCTEQTTSAFMSAVLAKENPKFFKEALVNKNLDEIIRAWVQKLSERQNADGGWSWWDGKSNVFLSAYVTEYLTRARKVGLKVDNNVLRQAEKYFSEEVSKTNLKISDSAWVKAEERSEVLRQQRVNRVASVYGRSLFNSNNLPELSVDGSYSSDLVAMALIANLRNGYNNRETNGYNLLWKQKKMEGNRIFWPAGDKEEFGSVDASTGVALRALLMAGADIDTTAPIVQYLLNDRHKEYWSSTFATAQIMEGFVQYAKKEKQSARDYRATIYLDGDLLKMEAFNAQKTIAEIDIPVTKIKKAGSQISIMTDKQDAVIYSTLFSKMYHTSTKAKPVSKTISLDRSYDNVDGGELKIGMGDVVLVKFEVDGLNKDDRYFVIEDQLPAGMVPLNEHLDNVDRGNNNENYRQDDRVHREYTKTGAILTDAHITNDGKHYYQYKARVVAGGYYNIPPARASLMYSPEVYAHSGTQTINLNGNPGSKNIANEGRINWKTKLTKLFDDSLIMTGGLIAVLLLVIFSLIYFVKFKK